MSAAVGLFRLQDSPYDEGVVFDLPSLEEIQSQLSLPLLNEDFTGDGRLLDSLLLRSSPVALKRSSAQVKGKEKEVVAAIPSQMEEESIWDQVVEEQSGSPRLPVFQVSPTMLLRPFTDLSTSF
jgi:hypothetical protein